jgi:lipopolysaccharide transport system ATP-binding protein
MSTVIKVENLSKQYRLGKVGTGTISHDLNRWWHNLRGKEDPYLKIGETNDRTQKGSTDYVWALQDINFEIEQGSAVGIIGRNGAGKSTLLKILSRTTAPTTGDVKLKGRVASLLEVGTGFHPELSGRENIYLNGAILGMTRREITRKFDEIVDFAGVERYVDTPVKRYSSGMYVRLAFAVAAHLESEILIVDEVLAVGDAEFQKKCLGKIRNVAGSGRTVLFVSHNMSAVNALCRRSVVLKMGKSIFDGPTPSAIAFYQEAFNAMQQTKISWLEHEAPGDERARLLAVTITPLQGDHIHVASGFQLHFTLKNNLKACSLDVSFELINQEEVIMIHHGKAVASSNDLLHGIYEVSASFPPYLFNEGEYRLKVWMGLNGVERVGQQVDNALVFTIENHTVDHILKRLPGVIRPKIDYKISHQPTAQSEPTHPH